MPMSRQVPNPTHISKISSTSSARITRSTRQLWWTVLVETSHGSSRVKVEERKGTHETELAVTNANLHVLEINKLRCGLLRRVLDTSGEIIEVPIRYIVVCRKLLV